MLEQLLGGLISGRPAKKKKRKLREFQMTVLSLDPKRARVDLAGATGTKKVDEVVKFAGVEYRQVQAVN